MDTDEHGFLKDDENRVKSNRGLRALSPIQGVESKSTRCYLPCLVEQSPQGRRYDNLRQADPASFPAGDQVDRNASWPQHSLRSRFSPPFAEPSTCEQERDNVRGASRDASS